jgi:peptidoglycan/LPS O-acetylase OafA/YrhL
MEETGTKKIYYFKKLDTLRFIAFLLVFWQHGFAKFFQELSKNKIVDSLIGSATYTGGAGVHIFFVISGFLITFLLIKEYAASDKINIKHFYLKRILRIWPLYYLVLLSGIFVLPHLSNAFGFNGSIFKSLCFLNNFDLDAINHNLNIGVAWSVAIEEQFYLFWPLLFIISYKRNLLNYICMALFALSTIYILRHEAITAYFHTLGNINYLMAGCLGASIYTKHQQRISTGFLMKRKTFYILIALAIIIRILSNMFDALSFLVIVFPVIYIFIVIYLVDSDSSSSVNFFSKMGKYTYGMYLYHAIILMSIKSLVDSPNSLVNAFLAILSFILTIGLSILSYRYFEMPFLKFKNKISLIKTRM